jgi:transposase
MEEDTASPSLREAAQAAAKRRRTKGLERREAIFDLFVSGFSHQQIASALKTSSHTVRRVINTAVADRRLDAPERFARVQVARLSKALSHADDRLERGDIRAFTPYLRIVAALDRYHGLEPRGLPNRQQSELAPSLPPPPLALSHAAPPGAGPAAEVADSGA